jgi:hypothetical protein
MDLQWISQIQKIEDAERIVRRVLNLLFLPLLLPTDSISFSLTFIHFILGIFSIQFDLRSIDRRRRAFKTYRQQAIINQSGPVVHE